MKLAQTVFLALLAIGIARTAMADDLVVEYNVAKPAGGACADYSVLVGTVNFLKPHIWFGDGIKFEMFDRSLNLWAKWGALWVPESGMDITPMEDAKEVWISLLKGNGDEKIPLTLHYLRSIKEHEAIASASNTTLHPNGRQLTLRLSETTIDKLSIESFKNEVWIQKVCFYP